MKEIKNPYKADIDRSNGNIEISIAKKYGDSEEPVYKKFMGMCASDDSYAVDTASLDDDSTVKACGTVYDKEMRSAFEKVEKNLSTFANLFQSQPMLGNLFQSQPMLGKKELKKEIANLFQSQPMLGQQQKSMIANLFQSQPMLGGLSKKQKENLSPELQKAIIKKMEKDGKLKKSEANLFQSQPMLGNLFQSQPMLGSEAETQDALSEDDKKTEVGPDTELKVVEKPKDPKSVEKHG